MLYDGGSSENSVNTINLKKTVINLLLKANRI